MLEALLLVGLYFLLLFITFYALWILCDVFLVPTVEIFIKQFDVPEEVAAVTFVAFGSAAPELFLNSASAIMHSSELSLSAILGSGMIAFGLIPPLCVLTASSRFDLSFKVAPILRECSFYLLGLLVFLVSVSDGRIVTAEAIAILSVYVSYVGLVLWLHGHRWWQRTGASNHINNIESDSRVRDDRGEDGTGGDNESNSQPCLASPLSRSHSLSSSSSLPRIITMNRDGYNEHQGLRLNLLGSSKGSLSQQILMINGNSNGSVHSHNSNSSEENEDVEAAEEPLLLLLRQSHVSSFSRDQHEEEGDDYYYSHSHGNRQNHYSFENVSTGLQGVFSRGVLCSSRRCYGLSLPLLEALPFKALFARLMPTLSSSLSSSSSSSPSLASALSRLAVCLCLLAVLASLLVLICRGLLSLMRPTMAQGSNASMLLGATLLALGSEIPDVVSAVALARSGLQDVALSQAIGSQVINISLGVGLPALLTCLLGDGQLLLAPEGNQPTDSKQQGVAEGKGGEGMMTTISQQHSRPEGIEGLTSKGSFGMPQLAFRLLLIVTVHLGITLGPHRLHRLLMSLVSTLSSSYRRCSSYFSSFGTISVAIAVDGQSTTLTAASPAVEGGGEEEIVKVSRCQAVLQFFLWLVVHMSLLRMIVAD